MRLRTKGFTIVELLIVIVVIAILAAISIVAYNGIQTRSLNTARATEMSDWRKIITLYNIQNGALPSVADESFYCLGSDFPDGYCRDYYPEADAEALMTMLATVATEPRGPRKPVNGTVGPYIYFWENNEGYSMYNVFNGGASDCPDNTEYDWDDGAGRLICAVHVHAQ